MVLFCVSKTDIGISPSHLVEVLSHHLSSALQSRSQLGEINLIYPVPHAMLQHIPRSQITALGATNAPMQGHPLDLAAIRTPVQEIVVVKHNIASLHLHHFLAWHVLLKRVGVFLYICESAQMRSWDHNQTGIVIKSQIPLSMPRRRLQPGQLLLRTRGMRNVISVPAQLEVLVWTDEQIIKLHDQIAVVLAADDFLDGAYNGIRKVAGRELLLPGHVGVEQVLDAPDSMGWIGGPWRELLGQRANIGPFSGSCQIGDIVASLAEGGYLIWLEGGWDEHEAIAVKVFFDVVCDDHFAHYGSLKMVNWYRVGFDIKEMN